MNVAAAAVSGASFLTTSTFEVSADLPIASPFLTSVNVAPASGLPFSSCFNTIKLSERGSAKVAVTLSADMTFPSTAVDAVRLALFVVQHSGEDGPQVSGSPLASMLLYPAGASISTARYVPNCRLVKAT